MKDKSDFPEVSLSLLKALDQRFKNQCPELDSEDRRVWYDAGARSVVNFLAAKYEQQNETILNPEK